MPLIHFTLENNKNGKKTHCSVKEFTAVEGLAYLPNWMMKQLELESEDEITIKLTTLVDGSKATLRINKQDQFLPNDPVVSLLTY
jgi:hypothetical protein